MTLDHNTLEVVVGATDTLSATVLPNNATNKTITWTTSNETIATVTNGVVRGVAAGSAVIKCTSKSDATKKAECNVTVKTPTISVSGISISPTTKSMKIGETYKISPTITPSNATDKTVTYTSKNTAVATVASNGTVTAKTSGSAVVEAVTKSGGHKASVSITVIDDTKLTVTAKAGTENGKTALTISPAKNTGNIYKALVGENSQSFVEQIPAINSNISDSEHTWIDWNGTDGITIANGFAIMIAECTSAGIVTRIGQTKAVINA